MFSSFVQSYANLNSSLKRNVFYVFLAGITVFLLLPLPPAKDPVPYLDKAQHIFIFIVLSMLGLLAYAQGIRKMIIFLVTYAAISEVLQFLLTTTRTGEVKDWVADCIGIAIGYWFFSCFNSKTS